MRVEIGHIRIGSAGPDECLLLPRQQPNYCGATNRRLGPQERTSALFRLHVEDNLANDTLIPPMEFDLADQLV